MFFANTRTNMYAHMAVSFHHILHITPTYVSNHELVPHEFYEMNLLNKSLSMNLFRMPGMAFIPDKTEPDIDRESDALTYTGVYCLDVIFKWGTR
jgi:hypothetical protein